MTIAKRTGSLALHPRQLPKFVKALFVHFLLTNFRRFQHRCQWCHLLILENLFFANNPPKWIFQRAGCIPCIPTCIHVTLAQARTCTHLYAFCAVCPLCTPNLIWWGCRAHLCTPVYPKTCMLAVYPLYTPDLIWWGCRAHLYTPVYPKTCILAVYLPALFRSKGAQDACKLEP